MTNTYSIIESCGRQFWVEPQRFSDFHDFQLRKPSTNISSTSLKVKRSVDISAANKILFNRVLILNVENDIYLGQPILDEFRVCASVLPGKRKQSKLYVFKMKSKKRFRRKVGYRVTATRIKFDNLYRQVKSKTNKNLQFLIKL